MKSSTLTALGQQVEVLKAMLLCVSFTDIFSGMPHLCCFCSNSVLTSILCMCLEWGRGVKILFELSSLRQQTWQPQLNVLTAAGRHQILSTHLVNTWSRRHNLKANWWQKANENLHISNLANLFDGVHISDCNSSYKPDVYRDWTLQLCYRQTELKD